MQKILKKMNEIKHWIKSTIPTDENFWNSRKADHVALRYCMSFVLKDELGLSYPQIAKLFNKDHSTLVIARKKHYHRINSKLSFDKIYGETYEKLLKTIPNTLQGWNEDVINIKKMELNKKLILAA